VRTTIRAGRVLGAAAAMVLLAGLAACASSSTPAAGGSTGSSSTASSAASALSSTAGSAKGGAPGSGAAALPAELDGVTLVATEVTGSHSIAPGSEISMTLKSDGTMSASAGCNRMAGGYTITGEVFNAPQLAMTMMACADPLVADQETWFAAFLASSPTWTFTGGTLTLTNGTDTVVLTSAPSGAEALQATGWKLVGLISKTATANTTTAVDPTLNAWARFSGGEIAYHTSCNRGGGSADIGDNTITFGPLRSALIACDGDSGSTEQAMNAVLQGTTPYTLKSDPAGALLTIMSADGSSGLQLTADPTVGADAFAAASPSPTATSGG